MNQDREGVCLAGRILSLLCDTLCLQGLWNVQVEMPNEQLEMCIWELGEIWTEERQVVIGAVRINKGVGNTEVVGILGSLRRQTLRRQTHWKVFPELPIPGDPSEKSSNPFKPSPSRAGVNSRERDAHVEFRGYQERL